MNVGWEGVRDMESEVGRRGYWNIKGVNLEFLKGKGDCEIGGGK